MQQARTGTPAVVLYTPGHLGHLLLCCCILWDTWNNLLRCCIYWDTCCCVVVYIGTPAVVKYIGTPAAVLLQTLEHLLLCFCVHWDTCCCVVVYIRTPAIMLHTLGHLLLCCGVHWNTCCCVVVCTGTPAVVLLCTVRVPPTVTRKARTEKWNLNIKGPLQSKILAFSVIASIFAVYVLSKRRAV